MSPEARYRVVPRPRPAPHHIQGNWRQAFLQAIKADQALEVRRNGQNVNSLRSLCCRYAQEAGYVGHLRWEQERPDIVIMWADRDGSTARKRRPA